MLYYLSWTKLNCSFILCCVSPCCITVCNISGYSFLTYSPPSLGIQSHLTGCTLHSPFVFPFPLNCQKHMQNGILICLDTKQDHWTSSWKMACHHEKLLKILEIIIGTQTQGIFMGSARRWELILGMDLWYFKRCVYSILLFVISKWKAEVVSNNIICFKPVN